MFRVCLPAIMKSWPLPRSRRRLLAVLALLTLFFTTASAQRGVEFGLGAYPAAPVLSAHVSVPLFDANFIEHRMRATVSYGFAGLPAVGVTYILRDADRTFLGTYLGGGLGLSFPDAPLDNVVLGGHLLAGMRSEVSAGLAVFGEVVVAGNRFGTQLNLGLGLSYRLGGGALR